MRNGFNNPAFQFYGKRFSIIKFPSDFTLRIINSNLFDQNFSSTVTLSKVIEIGYSLEFSHGGMLIDIMVDSLMPRSAEGYFSIL